MPNVLYRLHEPSTEPICNQNTLFIRIQMKSFNFQEMLIIHRLVIVLEDHSPDQPNPI
jgi:hypothetical protein